MVKVSLTVSLPYDAFVKLQNEAIAKGLSSNRHASEILERATAKKTQTITKKERRKK